MDINQNGHRPKRIVTVLNNLPCPRCGSHSTGAIANNRYFCADCCTEYIPGSHPVVYEISAAGNIVRSHCTSLQAVYRGGNVHVS